MFAIGTLTNSFPIDCPATCFVLENANPAGYTGSHITVLSDNSVLINWRDVIAGWTETNIIRCSTPDGTNTDTVWTFT